MNWKTFAFVVWTATVVAALVLIGSQVTKDQVYTGTKIEFSTNRTIQIDADKVTFQAASLDFFVLRKQTGETIAGAPAPKPLGWPNSQYFVAGPQEIPGGEWLFADGSAAVKITSGNAVTVRLIEPNLSSVWILLTLGAFVIWGIVILLFSV